MKKYSLWFIIILAFILRFYRLGDYPALNADEAAIGYNAYSLLQTGRDEHGNSWPTHFQSFNDYKPGLYFYLVLPFVKFFGLNEWAVRIPGAILGVLTVFIVYLLTNKLFSDQKFKIWNLEFGIWPAFLLAISPWHIHFSRGGWEVNVATFFIVCGVWLYLKFLKNSTLLFFSFLFFSLSLYSYHAARIVTPLLLLGILVIYRDVVRHNLKHFLLAGLVGLIVLTPLLKELSGPAGISRAAGVGLFADSGPILRINESRGEHADYKSLQAVLLHNKAINFGLSFLENWTEHFHGEFLFVSGDEIQRNKVPETGQMYLFDILLLALGLVALARNFSRQWILIFWWLIVAPTAAALTFQSPHALRAQNMVIPLVIISALGLFSLISWIDQNVKRKSLLFTFYFLFFTFSGQNFARYLHMYWVHMAKEYPFSSQYGVKELVQYTEKNQDKYEKIIVTGRYDQPYILFLFYLKYPPEIFQKEHVLTQKDDYGFSTVRNFSKYYFQPIVFDEIRPANPNTLIAGTDKEIPEYANVIEKIYGKNGYLYFEVVAN